MLEGDQFETIVLSKLPVLLDFVPVFLPRVLGALDAGPSGTDLLAWEGCGRGPVEEADVD